MSYGLGIFLLVLGAILSFAVTDRISGVDLTMVGYICMAAGVLAIILTMVTTSQRQKTRTEAVVEHRETGLPPEDRRRL